MNAGRQLKGARSEESGNMPISVETTGYKQPGCGNRTNEETKMEYSNENSHKDDSNANIIWHSMNYGIGQRDNKKNAVPNGIMSISEIEHKERTSKARCTCG